MALPNVGNHLVVLWYYGFIIRSIIPAKHGKQSTKVLGQFTSVDDLCTGSLKRCCSQVMHVAAHESSW
jgi:hypothetical protein